jgi:hypothetical protein
MYAEVPGVDLSQIYISFEQNVLTKARAAQPRRIEIKTEKQHPVEISHSTENASAKASNN